MYRHVLPFPLAPGKTEADARIIADRFYAEPKAYAESRRAAGVTMERAYLQKTPMGLFVVAYIESSRGSRETMEHWLKSDLELDRFFVDSVRQIHGVDVKEVLAGPPAETVGEWVDASVTGRRRGMAFCAPMIPEQLDHGREWTKRTFATEGMTRSRRALGENVEVVTVVQTPQGPVVAVYLEGNDPWEANRGLVASTDQFDVDFRAELKKIFPPFVNFDEPVEGVSEIFNSERLLASV